MNRICLFLSYGAVNDTLEGRYLHNTQQIREEHPCSQRDSNPQNKQSSSRRSTQQTAERQAIKTTHIQNANSSKSSNLCLFYTKLFCRKLTGLSLFLSLTVSGISSYDVHSSRHNWQPVLICWSFSLLYYIKITRIKIRNMKTCFKNFKKKSFLEGMAKFRKVTTNLSCFSVRPH